MKESPFDLSPNPAHLYLTPALKSTIHKIRYTIDKRRGLTCLLGDVGMGKSSVVRLLHAEYSAKESASVCLIPTPNFTSDFGLLKAICADFGIPPKNSLYNQEQELNGWLLEHFKGDKNVVVFIDEAQTLTDKMLERIRTLLNLETNTTKLMQIVLAGQIELKERLMKPSKKALRSRIFAPSVLDCLSLGETRRMIEYRCEREEISCPIPDFLFEIIYNLTGGVPRNILKLCDVAYELMRLNGEKTFSPELVKAASGESGL